MTKNSVAPQAGRAFDLAIFIGRFQPFHCGHLAVIESALTDAKHVLVLIGSARSPRCHRNPFTYDERRHMIIESVGEEAASRVLTAPLPDTSYNDEQWVTNVQHAARDAAQKLGLPPGARIALVGHSKDATSYYLTLFPQWESIEVPSYHNLSATPLRESYFSNIGHMWLSDCDGHRIGDLPQDHIVPTPVRTFLSAFLNTDDYRNIRAEYEFVLDYKTQWARAPYEPTFTTVDACVIQSGHVLLVRRRGRPGKGLWALPGGFLNPSEKIKDAMLRELREETKIGVPTPVLNGSIVATRVFDDPNRSARGRTITHGFLIHLRPDTSLPPIRRKRGKDAPAVVASLPEVEGADDAEKAVWWPLADVVPEMMFEDHYDMINYFQGLI